MRIFWSYTTQTNLARKKNLIQQNEALKKIKEYKNNSKNKNAYNSNTVNNNRNDNNSDNNKTVFHTSIIQQKNK